MNNIKVIKMLIQNGMINQILNKLDLIISKTKFIETDTVLDYYLQFGNIRSRQTIELEIDQELPYYAYTSMRRSSKMKGKRIELSEEIKRKMIDFFLKTSIPKMLAE